MSKAEVKFGRKIYEALCLPWNTENDIGRRELFSLANICRRIDESELPQADIPKFKSLITSHAHEISDPKSKKFRYHPSAERRVLSWNCLVLDLLRFYTWNKYARNYALRNFIVRKLKEANEIARNKSQLGRAS